MMLVKKSNIRSLAISCFAFLSFSAIPTLALAAAEFTSNVKKIDIGQPGLNDMIAADFNNDGNMDVIISEYDGIVGGSGIAAVIIHFGDITGNLENNYSLPGPTLGDGLLFSPAGLAVGDVDGDNILDIAVAGLTNSSSSNGAPLNATRIFKGYLSKNKYQFRDPAVTAADPLAPNPVIPEIVYTVGVPYDVAIGNFTNDTFVDVVVAHELGISLFVGIGNGKFDATEVRISVSGATNSPTKIVAMDMNNDGLLDIVTDHEVLFNNNDNTFTLKASYGSTNLPKKIFKVFTVDDFNNDKLNDVAFILETPTPQQSELVVLLAKDNGSTITYSKTTLPKFPAAEISAIATGDIDIDGIVDIIMTDLAFDNVLYLYTGIGDGTFSAIENITINSPPATVPPTAVNNVSKPKLLVVTKADNDRLLDIITANNTDTQTPSLSVLLQKEPATESFVFAPKTYEATKPASSPLTLPIKVLRKYKQITPAANTIISYTVNDATAINNIDFEALVGQIDLNFAAADLSKTIDVKILPLASTEVLNSKSFNIDLNNLAGQFLDKATITIKSNVITPTIGFSAQSFNLYEEPGKLAVITVTRTDSTLTSTVQVITQTITTPNIVVATAGTDYTVLTNKLITFNSGELSKMFTVAIVDDSEVEGAEKFIVKLVNPTNSTISVATAVVTIVDNDIAAPVNNKPIANSDSYPTPKNTKLVVPVPGVLINDSDKDIATVDIANTLKVRLAPNSTVAGLILASNGSFTYQPEANFSGPVTFQYIASDGIDDSAPATVTINIVNAKPVANADTYSTLKNTDLNISAILGLLANDTDKDKDPLTVRLAPGSSLVNLTLNSDGSFLYKPVQGFTGTVSFDYVVNDGTDDSAAATVSISVFPQTEVTFGQFSFDASNSYTVAEEQEVIIINVSRNLGQSGEVLLTYSIKNNTAIAGTDFNDITAINNIANTLIFADGVTSMPITIKILKDTEIEPAEDFLISLMSVSAGVLANENTSNSVTITDSTPTPIQPAVSNSTSGGGGGCTLQAESRFDPVLPLMMLFALLYFGRRINLKLKK